MVTQPGRRARSALALLCSALVLAGCQADLQGTELNQMPAFDFELTDHHGQRVALGDFYGRPVVVTFLFTSCPDVCPLTAQRIRTALDLLGEDAARVGVLAVSVDPRGDDLEAARTFSEAHGLLNRWHYLIGQRHELEPIWRSYFVAAVEHPVPGGPAYRFQVGHTDATYLVDKQGRLRTLLRADFDPAAMARDLRTLLRE